MANTGNLIPFCIYHRIDENTNTFWGFISSPRKTVSQNGEVSYSCAPEPRTYRQWRYAGMFYGMEPNFRPIPLGMKIFCAQRSDIYPYDTVDVNMMYDPYNIKESCVYFMTYAQPVPNTVPLYLHQIGIHTYPSFDKKPPTNDPEWTQAEVSPIFVMTEQTVGNISSVKFKCLDGRCIPWTKDIADLYDDDPHRELLNLQECVQFCSELSVSKTHGAPSHILERVAAEGKAFARKRLYVVTGFLVLSIVTLVAVWILLKKNENRRKRT
jgi:hypothetical protein